MKIVYVPMNSSYSPFDTCNGEIPGFDMLDEAVKKSMRLINPSIAVCAEYFEKGSRSMYPRRLFLGWYADLWIPGVPEEDGEYLVLFARQEGDLYENEQTVLGFRDGKWLDFAYGEIKSPISGYRPLIPR